MARLANSRPGAAAMAALVRNDNARPRRGLYCSAGAPTAKRQRRHSALAEGERTALSSRGHPAGPLFTALRAGMTRGLVLFVATLCVAFKAAVFLKETRLKNFYPPPGLWPCGADVLFSLDQARASANCPGQAGRRRMAVPHQRDGDFKNLQDILLVNSFSCLLLSGSTRRSRWDGSRATSRRWR